MSMQYKLLLRQQKAFVERSKQTSIVKSTSFPRAVDMKSTHHWFRFEQLLRPIRNLSFVVFHGGHGALEMFFVDLPNVIGFYAVFNNHMFRVVQQFQNIGI